MSPYLDAIQSHLTALITHGCARMGPSPSAMWMASLDTRTKQYPDPDTRPESIPKRVYRYIDAPRGCSLYWDQPSIVAAHALSALTGRSEYAGAADDYVRVFLDRCVASNGVFLWGNHYYYDAFRGTVMHFRGSDEAQPWDAQTEDGHLHETRPLPPAWDTFWRVDPAATERCVRALADMHLFDAQIGGFNRHADRHRGCAFLEAGGILCEMMAWLSARTGDTSLVPAALRVAQFSAAHKGTDTGLLENNPTGDHPDQARWDKTVCTTEVGLWAGCLVRAAGYTGARDFVDLAASAVAAYLKYGYEANTGRFFGRLRVVDGEPDRREPDTPYQPGVYAGLWKILFPTHDYPFQFAEACLDLHAQTGDPAYAQGVERWVGMIVASLPANEGRGAYAENYGRAIHFLARAAQALGREDWRQQAESVAQEALGVLYAHGMFRSHPGEDRYDAVDGVGMLLLAFMRLETGMDPDLMGFGF